MNRNYAWWYLDYYEIEYSVTEKLKIKYINTSAHSSVSVFIVNIFYSVFQSQSIILEHDIKTDLFVESSASFLSIKSIYAVFFSSQFINCLFS